MIRIEAITSIAITSGKDSRVTYWFGQERDSTKAVPSKRSVDSEYAEQPSICRPKYSRTPMSAQPVALTQLILTSENKLLSRLKTNPTSPWHTHHILLKLGFKKIGLMAYNTKSSQIVVVKHCQISRLTQARLSQLAISHDRFVRVQDFYEFDSNLYVIQECMEVSLSEVIACPVDLDETHIYPWR